VVGARSAAHLLVDPHMSRGACAAYVRRVSSDVPVRLRPEIAATAPYRQGAPAGPDAFKLSSNENPFAPLPGVLEAMRGAADINRYPRFGADRLRSRLAERFGVEPDAVHVSAGSTATLIELLSAAVGPGDEVVFAWRSFEAYPLFAMVAGARIVQVPLGPDGRQDLDAMAAAVTERTRVVIVCSPNNPTGPAVRRDEFERFVAAVPRNLLVVLDEAYAEFVTDPDAVDGAHVLQHPNIVVVRTFSKAYGLAGLRIGYALGHPRVLDAARVTAVPLAVTAVAEAAAVASLDAEDELRGRVRELVRRRDALVAGLHSAGWRVPDAQGNFVWLETGSRTADAVAAFAAAGLVVRPLGEGLRITVGEEASIARVVEVAAGAVAVPR
jgi:histidinol-phosphate aminotransferase